MSEDQPNYDFIMNPEEQPKQKFGGKVGGLDPFIKKLIFLIGGAIIFIVVATIGINLIFGSTTNLDQLVGLTQTEQEIVRVSTTNKATDQIVKDSAMNTQLSVKSQQRVWLNFLAGSGREVNEEELALKRSTTTDQKLVAAEKSGTYDEALTEEMRSELEAYLNQLRQAFQDASDQTEKTLLQKHYKEVQLLLKQWPEPPADTSAV
jgi:predicted metalloprotease